MRVSLLLFVALAACQGMIELEPPADAGPLPREDSGVTPPRDGGASEDAGPTAFDAGSPDASVPEADAGLDAGRDAGVDGGRPTRPVFVIGGQDMRHLVSFDGRAWEHDTYVAPNGEDNAFSGAAVGAGCIVLAGDPGIFRSTDGVTWTLVQQRPSRFAFHGNALAYANGQFVLVSQDTAWTSADGVTWQSRSNTGAAGHWHALTFGNGHWLALGDGLRKLSENGLDWHDATPFTAGLFEAVAFGNGRFVAVGKEAGNGWVATSSDGLTWTAQAAVPTQYMTGLGTVAFGGGAFVTSTCCATLRSADGESWTTLGTNGSGGGIVWAGGTFVSSGWRTEAKVFSADAGRWQGTISGDLPNSFPDAGIAPWFTALGAGEL